MYVQGHRCLMSVPSQSPGVSLVQSGDPNPGRSVGPSPGQSGGPSPGRSGVALRPCPAPLRRHRRIVAYRTGAGRCASCSRAAHHCVFAGRIFSLPLRESSAARVLPIAPNAAAQGHVIEFAGLGAVVSEVLGSTVSIHDPCASPQSLAERTEAIPAADTGSGGDARS